MTGRSKVVVPCRSLASIKAVYRTRCRTSKVFWSCQTIMSWTRWYPYNFVS